MDTATLITRIITESGTDASRATVLANLQEAYDTQVVDSRFLLETVSIGPTVAGTSDYALPDGVLDVLGVKVGSYEFAPTGIKGMWDLSANGGGSWNGRYGYYAPNYSSSGATTITLFPTPDTSGSAITVLSPATAGALADSSGSTPITPSDTHGSLIDGATALILSRIDERPDMAPPFQDRFERATEKLRRRKNSRVGGAMQAQIYGVHWS